MVVRRKLYNPESFSKAVKTVVRNIPKGQTMSYGQVARAVGLPRHARAVAKVMANNYLPDVPCHRVIRSDGRLGGYNRGGLERKAALLRQEGYLR